MTLSDKKQGMGHIYELGEYSLSFKDVKEFIKWCDKHSFVTDEGLRVIDINKLKEEAGEDLI